MTCAVPSAAGGGAGRGAHLWPPAPPQGHCHVSLQVLIFITCRLCPFQDERPFAQSGRRGFVHFLSFPGGRDRLGCGSRASLRAPRGRRGLSTPRAPPRAFVRQPRLLSPVSCPEDRPGCPQRHLLLPKCPVAGGTTNLVPDEALHGCRVPQPPPSLSRLATEATEAGPAAGCGPPGTGGQRGCAEPR